MLLSDNCIFAVEISKAMFTLGLDPALELGSGLARMSAILSSNSCWIAAHSSGVVAAVRAASFSALISSTRERLNSARRHL
jgi:hypothetical protein